MYIHIYCNGRQSISKRNGDGRVTNPTNVLPATALHVATVSPFFEIIAGLGVAGYTWTWADNTLPCSVEDPE